MEDISVRRRFVSRHNTGMRLKRIGAAIIVASLVFTGIAMRVAHPYTWLDRNWPLLLFVGLVIGGMVGAIGMRASAAQRRRESSN